MRAQCIHVRAPELALRGMEQGELLENFRIRRMRCVALALDPVLDLQGLVQPSHRSQRFSAAGTPDIAGFLFEHGTLTHIGDPDEEEEDERQEMQPAMVDTPKPPA